MRETMVEISLRDLRMVKLMVKLMKALRCFS